MGFESNPIGRCVCQIGRPLAERPPRDLSPMDGLILLGIIEESVGNIFMYWNNFKFDEIYFFIRSRRRNPLTYTRGVELCSLYSSCSKWRVGNKHNCFSCLPNVLVQLNQQGETGNGQR